MSFLFRRSVKHQSLDLELNRESAVPAVPATESWLHNISAPVELDSRESVGERRVNINDGLIELPPQMVHELASRELMDEHAIHEPESTQESRAHVIHWHTELPVSNSIFHIDIWPQNDFRMDLTENLIGEREISDWLQEKGEFFNSSYSRVQNRSTLGRLRVLYGDFYRNWGQDGTHLPFSQASLEEIKTALNLSRSFDQMLNEKATCYSKRTLFDDSGNVSGYTFVVKYFSWWLGTWILGLSFDQKNNVATALLLGREAPSAFKDVFSLVEASKDHAGHPMFLPLILCDLLTDRYAHEVDRSTKRILALETSIGVNDYIALDHSKESKKDTATDFTKVSQVLNGEVSRLANYEKWVLSCVNLLRELLGGSHFTTSDDDSSKSPSQRIEIALKERGENILGRNVDLVARIHCQQKIAQGQIQTVYNLLAQRDNKLNISIAASTKRDSTAMKTIAIVTMVFLPGAYVATLFSMTMFDWQASSGQILSPYFWVYWAITMPVTLFVLLVWGLWAQPWK